MSLRKLFLIAVGCIATAVFGASTPGCGGSGKPAAIPATGKVMFKKATPTDGALVVFHPVDPNFEKTIGGKPFGKVKEDGSFSLTTYADGDGAPEGEYGVTIDWRPKPKDGKGPKISLSTEGGGGGPSAIQPKYSDPTKPFTKVTVKKGQANEFSFDVD